jgi:hypothetical protein
MPVILKNNAFSTLAAGATASDTGIVVASGSAFPAITAGEYFYVTLVSQAGTTEIIKVTARVGNSMTVVRAQDGSTAATFQVGTLVDMRVNVASIAELRDEALPGSAAAPAYTFSTDLNTGMYSVAADNLGFSAGGIEQLRLSNGFAQLLGSTTETRALGIGAGRTGNGIAVVDLIGDATYTGYGARFIRGDTGPNAGTTIAHRGTGDLLIAAQDAGSVAISTSGSERLRINAAGNAAMGTALPSGSRLRLLKDNTTNYSDASLELMANTGDPTIGFHAVGATAVCISHARGTSNIDFTSGDRTAFTPIRASAFNVSSDHRLKENVTPLGDAIARVSGLQPKRFNFLEGSMMRQGGHTVDGFIAHEVSAVVPEAVTGERDAVNEDGAPIYQGIDQAKLVPLLTAALQEAIAKITALEARITALEI